jgi:hypothetical protein
VKRVLARGDGRSSFFQSAGVLGVSTTVGMAVPVLGMYAAGAVALVVGVALVLQVPALGLMLLLPMVSILPPAPQAIGIGEILFAALVLTTLASSFLLQGRASRYFDHLQLSVMAVVGLMLMSVIWGTAHGTQLDDWFRGIVPFMALLLIIPGQRLLRVPRADLFVIVSFYAAGLWAAFGTVSSGAAGLSTAIDFDNALFIRTALSPEAYQIPLLAPWAFALGAVLLGNDRRPLHLAALAIFSGALALTLLRSVVVIAGGLIVLALIVLYLHRQRLRSLATALSLAVLGAVLTTSPGIVGLITSGYASRFEVEGGGTAIRMDEFGAIAESVSASPVLGLGLGYTYSYYREGLGVTWVGAYTHNVLSYALLTMGAVGLLAVSVMLLLMTRRAWLALMDRSPMLSDVRYGLAFTMLAVIAYSMVQSSFRTLGFAVVLAICAIGLRRDDDHAEVAPS